MIAIMFTSTPLKQVTKYQAIEDVTCMLQGTDLAPLELSDTDLSVYSWLETCQLTHMLIYLFIYFCLYSLL